MTETTTTYQAGYAGTGRKVHLAIEGGPSNCTGTRWGTRLHSCTTSTDLDELAAKLHGRGVRSGSVCRSCAYGLQQRVAALEVTA